MSLEKKKCSQCYGRGCCFCNNNGYIFIEIKEPVHRELKPNFWEREQEKEDRQKKIPPPSLEDDIPWSGFEGR